MLADRTSSMIRWWLVVLSWQGKLARYQGQPAEAWAQVRAVLPNGRETEPGERTFQEAVEMQRLAVALSLDAGDLAAAWVWLDTHHRWLDWSGAVLGQAEGQLLWARYHQAAGDLALARQHADQALAHACEPRQPLTLLASHRFLGRLNTLEARHDDAQTHLGESLALAKACAAPFERALTLLEFARLRAAQGQTDETHQILNEVRTICEPLQARPALEQVAAVEAQLQEQPRAAVTPFGLTPRELDVLRLVAEGLTDPEVAERLYVSPRTVSSHLTSVYTKLGVSSRAAATRIAVEHRFL
jgi:DNA-binding CsgD family transcriptional regulator